VKPALPCAVLPEGQLSFGAPVTSRLVRAAAATFGAALLFISSQLHAQDERARDGDGRHSLDLGVGGVGISIGDSKRWTGLRLNYRDSRLEEVKGINATIWGPYEHGAGAVNGLALGLPLTGASDLTGLGVGIFGFGVEHSFTGIGIAGLGMGGGGNLNGIAIAGLGAGMGGNLNGVFIGGLGAGGGGDVRGIGVGGLGLGAGGRLTGIAVGGLGVGAGGGAKGLLVGGLGAGTGGDLTGIGIGGLGVGAGGDITGVVIGGVGAGFGGTLRGLGIGGVGVGGQRIRGIAIGGIGVGGEDLKGGFATLGVLKVENNGRFQGIGVAGFSQIKGEHHGLTISVVNYARDLRGVQVGLINIAQSNPKATRVLPLFNANFSK
jgi:hypothetical protein